MNAPWSRTAAPHLVLPADTLDIAGTDAIRRGRERSRRAVLGSVGGIGARGISYATAMLIVPPSLHYLGTERYGMWMTIGSLIALLSFADLGIGSGVMNGLSAANGRDDRRSAARLLT